MKWVLFLFFLAVLTSVVTGATFYETSIKEIGYDTITAQGAKQTECVEILFSLPEKWEQNTVVSPLVSINFTSNPVLEGDARISIGVNDSTPQTFAPIAAFCKENTCWKRIPLLREQVTQELNTLSLCAQTSNTITQLIIHNTSKIGLYTTPVFSIETIPESYTPTFGETVNIQVTAQNTGSETASIRFQRAREVAADKNVFRVVDGDTRWEGELVPGTSETITYTIRPKIHGPFSIPPAIVFFENIFGEPDFLFAQPVQLVVQQPEKPVDVRIIKQTETIRVGEKTPITIAIKNKTQNKLEAVKIGIVSSLTLAGEQSHTFTLPPHETATITVFGVSSVPGTFTLGCTVSLPEYGSSVVRCADQSIIVVQEVTQPSLIWGIGFILLGVLVYILIRFSP
jgi:hypothetical protein